MKRFTVISALFSVSIVALWLGFQAFTASPAKANLSGNPQLVPVTGAEVRAVAPAPVYDASGRIIALNRNGSSNEAVILAPAANIKIAPVYDATGLLKSDPNGTISSVSFRKIAPVYNARGELVSDPTGTIWSESNP